MSDPTAQTAARLVKQAPEILRRWERRVRAEVSSSKKVEGFALRNRLGFLLAGVARGLSPAAGAEPLIEGLTLSQDHGAQRATHAGYTLADVFLEYRVLWQTVLDALREGGPLPLEECEAITDAIELAMQEAGSQYALVQHAAERERGDEARQLAAKLRQAYDRERRITEVLQRPLLLKVAEDAFAGFCVATLYEPAGQEADVGGDFLDIFALPRGKIALVVADACGKGLEAAAHNTHVKDVLRAFLREKPSEPGPILGRLNDVVWDMLHTDPPADEDTFIVLALGVLDPAAGGAVFAAAGAEPPTVVRAGGKAEVVGVGGMAMGIRAGEPYRQAAVSLDAGDTVLMVTDGVTEARCGGAILGSAGMLEFAKRSLQAASLYDAGHAILESARAFAGGSLQDDASLILARRTGTVEG